MANSTSANLKLTVQATGENSGTWGQITNTNLLILEQAIGGYDAVGVTSGATLTFSNGALSNGKNAVLKLTGTIAGAVNVVIPDSIEKTFVVQNSTTGAYTVTFKTTSGTGVTWAATDKGTKMVYSDGTNVVDTAFTDLSSDYSPQLSANLDTNSNNIVVDTAHGILDESSNEQLIFSTTGAAVNHIQVQNAATSGTPSISAIGDDTNINISIQPKGTGQVTLDNLTFPAADGTVDQILTTDGSGNLSFVDNSGGTSWQTVITADPANAVAGNGYFCDTSGGAFTVTLPTTPALGDEISFVDYAGTFDTNNLTIGRNGNPIQGAASDLTVSVERAGLTLVFVDGTEGWLLKNK
jgi:hypothetical protein